MAKNKSTPAIKTKTVSAHSAQSTTNAAISPKESWSNLYRTSRCDKILKASLRTFRRIRRKQRQNIHRLILVGAVATDIVVTAMGAATAASAGPAGIGDADAVIQALRAEGYRVIVSKGGTKIQSECAVQSVTKQSPVYTPQPARDVRNAPTTVRVLDRKVAVVVLKC